MVNVSAKAERITIMLDSDLGVKLRVIQAKKIKKTNKGYSYSKAINDTLRKCL